MLFHYADIVPEYFDSYGKKNDTEEFAHHQYAGRTEEAFQQVYGAQRDVDDNEVDEYGDEDIVILVSSLERHNRSKSAGAGYKREGNRNECAGAGIFIGFEKLEAKYHFQAEDEYHY